MNPAVQFAALIGVAARDQERDSGFTDNGEFLGSLGEAFFQVGYVECFHASKTGLFAEGCFPV